MGFLEIRRAKWRWEKKKRKKKLHVMMQYIKKHLGKHYLTFCSWSKGLAIIWGYNIRQWKTLKNYVETKHLWERIAYLHLKLFSLRQNLQDVWNIATHGTYGNQNCRFVSTKKNLTRKYISQNPHLCLQKIRHVSVSMCFSCCFFLLVNNYEYSKQFVYTLTLNSGWAFRIWRSKVWH